MSDLSRCISRNIFDYAPIERAQDAMIAWLISSATAPDTALRDVGRAFIRFLLRADLSRTGSRAVEKAVIGKDDRPHTYDGPGELSEVIELRAQYHHIDVYCLAKIDGKKISFVIEDKTHTTQHSNQLQRYRKIAQRDNIPEDYLKLLYLKTGMPDDDEREQVAAQDFSFIGIHDLDDFLSRDPAMSASNDVLAQIRQRIRSVRDDHDRGVAFWDMKFAPVQVRFLEGLQSRGDRFTGIERGRNRGGAGPFTKLAIDDRGRPRDWFLFWRIDTYRPLRLMIYRGSKRGGNVKEENAKLVDHYGPMFDQAVEEAGGLATVRSSRRRAFEPAIGAIGFPVADKTDESLDRAAAVHTRKMNDFLDRVAAVHARFLDLAEL